MEQSQENNILVSAKNISMEFKIPDSKVNTLKERVVNLVKGKKIRKRRLKVLDDISFEIERGKSLGVIGHNGAGKSTLLKIVAGIFEPTSGTATVNGSAVLLSLGAGFDMEANAIENIFLNGAILGFSRKQMKERLPSIIEFSELGDFLSMPLKNYSSGMISRLGFAIAIDIHPDLLLVDEILSVGDANFQKKCGAKIDELKQSGVSFMFVSHNIGQVKKLCENTIWIENSRVQAYGPSEDVCKKYLDYCASLQTPKVAQSTTQNVEKK